MDIRNVEQIMGNEQVYGSRNFENSGNSEVKEQFNSTQPDKFNNDFKSKKKGNIKTYLSVVLISSILSSSLIGGVIYSKFNKELKKQAELIQNIASKSETTSSDETGNSINFMYANSGSGINTSGLGTLALASSKNLTITEIAEKAGKSIVGIRMTFVSSSSRLYQYSAQSLGEGSGIIINKDGYIMTNYHVVEYADPKNNLSKNITLEVFLPDGREASAKFVGGDSLNDLAVIKIDLDNLPVAELGDSSKLKVGELAVAIGNPLGMEFAGTVTAGIISALNREIETTEKTQRFIQTDAAINPGNSGGALVNSQGQVIGINTIKISFTGVEGLGFAIPINDAKPIVEQLINYGYVKDRPYIGINGQEISEIISRQFGIPTGLFITEVDPEGSAYKAGIKRGDIITKFADKEVRKMSDINNIKENYKPGDVVTVTIIRNNKEMTIKLTLTEQS